MTSIEINTKPQPMPETREQAALRRINENGGKAYKYHEGSEAGHIAARKATIRAERGMPQRNQLLERLNALPITKRAKRAAAYGAIAVATGVGTGAVASLHEADAASKPQAPEAIEAGPNQEMSAIQEILNGSLEHQNLLGGVLTVEPGTNIYSSPFDPNTEAGEVAFTIPEGQILRITSAVEPPNGDFAVFTMGLLEYGQNQADMTFWLPTSEINNLSGEGGAHYNSLNPNAPSDALPGPLQEGSLSAVSEMYNGGYGNIVLDPGIGAFLLQPAAAQPDEMIGAHIAYGEISADTR